MSISMRADLLRRIHVIPGRIARSNPRNPSASVLREYDAVLGITSWPDPTMECIKLELATAPEGPTVGHPSEERPELAISEPAPTKQVMDSRLQDVEMTAEVIESGLAGEVIFFYRLSTPNGEVIGPPGEITMAVLQNTGLVVCRKSGCRPIATDRALQLFTVKRGWNLSTEEADRVKLPVEAAVCCDWMRLGSSEVGRLTALAVQR